MLNDKGEQTLDDDGKPITKMEPRTRDETVLDLEATLRLAPLTPPATSPHVHRACHVCGTTWPERLKG